MRKSLESDSRSPARYGTATAITKGMRIETMPVMMAETNTAGLPRRSASSLPSSATIRFTGPSVPSVPFHESEVDVFEGRFIRGNGDDVSASLDERAHDCRCDRLGV